MYCILRLVLLLDLGCVNIATTKQLARRSRNITLSKNAIKDNKQKKNI